MSESVSSLSPADAAVGVQPWQGISVTYASTGTLDPDLIELDVNGVSCTEANGLLTIDPYGKITGGTTLEVDWSQAEVRCSLRWYALQGQEVVVDCLYSSSSLATATWTPTLPGEGGGAWDGSVWAWATSTFPDRAVADAELMVIYKRYGAQADAELMVIYKRYGAQADAELLVSELMRHVAADARLWIAHWRLDDSDASGVSAERALSYSDASGLVLGWALQDSDASGIVQGWRLDDLDASGLVGIRFVYYGEASGVVGLEVLGYLAASGVVFGVNRNNVLEVEVIDPSTYAALTAAGVTWS